MLVLTRGHEKSILIGDNIEVIVTGFMMMNENGKWEKVKPTFPVQVQLGFKAPRSVNIMRGEAVKKAVDDVDKMAKHREETQHDHEDRRPRHERKRRHRTRH